jgi:hypothetical protein
MLTSCSSFVVRSVEGIAAIVVPLATKGERRELFDWGIVTSLPCSLLHDLGTFCIVLSLTRVLFHALDIWDWTFLNIIRRFWGWAFVLLPFPGYFLASFVAGFKSMDDSDLQNYDSKRVNGYNALSYSILRANIISLGVTMLAMAPLFFLVLIKRRKGQLWASSTAFVTAVAFFPTLIFMIAYMANDMLRLSINHRPTVAAQFALGLAPEVIVTVMWLAVARHIGVCDQELLSRQEAARERKANEWCNEIDKASTDMRLLSLADTNQEAETKDFYSIEQTELNVYSCARHRLQRLYEHYNQRGQSQSSNFIEEERLLIEDAKQNALLIARCLIMAPCEDHSLFGRAFLCGDTSEGLRPPFSSLKTAKLVLEAMKKEEAMKALKSEELEWAVSDLVKIHLR